MRRPGRPPQAQFQSVSAHVEVPTVALGFDMMAAAAAQFLLLTDEKNKSFPKTRINWKMGWKVKVALTKKNEGLCSSLLTLFDFIPAQLDCRTNMAVPECRTESEGCENNEESGCRVRVGSHRNTADPWNWFYRGHNYEKTLNCRSGHVLGFMETLLLNCSH